MENNQRNSRKRLNSLILLVAFTAIMLIVSTYAWFSTQKNVTLGGLEGKVNVAEGLQISLDALNWRNEIDLSASGIVEYFKATNDANTTEYDLSNPYTGRYNSVPDELLPASTTGRAETASEAGDADGIGLSRLNMYRGENTDGIVLSKIELLKEDGTSADKNENGSKSGYYAIDFFLQNSSSETAIAGNVKDLLRLESNSSISLKTTTKESTGLQNTLRVGFALFNNDGGNANDVLVSATPSQSQILGGMNGQNIVDVAIWEPNASGATEKDSASNTITKYGAHVDYIVQNNNRIKWSKADANTYLGQTIDEEAKVLRFNDSHKLPTYALTKKSLDSKYTVSTTNDTQGIANIYDWSDTSASGLEKQITNATTTAGVGNDPIQLKNIKDEDFAIAPGEYHKIRMYVWLEGQDVDCINYASLGGQLSINVGLSKPGTTNSGTAVSGS